MLLFSCKTEMNICGHYANIHRGQKYVPWIHNLMLNDDSTYKYYYSSGWIKEVSFGNWKMDKDGKRVIINSFIQDIHNIPVVVAETKSNNHSFPLFVFDNPLKLDTSVKWVLNVNDTDYPLNTDSLVLDKGIVFESFYLTGHITLEDSTSRVPIPLQDTIQSEKYNVKNTSSNLYHISFPAFVDYNIFHYKPLQDSLKLNKNTLLFDGIKLKKK